MPKILTVGTDEFEFPLEGENAGYGSEVTDWAEAVTGALSTVERPGDIINKTAIIADSQPSFTAIPEFTFSSAIVASFEAKYYVQRTSTAGSKREAGFIEGYHDGSDWIIAIRTIGDGGIDLDINSTGQVRYKTSSSLGGTSYTGFIKFEAKVINK
jgi:hypothetical protein